MDITDLGSEYEDNHLDDLDSMRISGRFSIQFKQFSPKILDNRRQTQQNFYSEEKLNDAKRQQNKAERI